MAPSTGSNESFKHEEPLPTPGSSPLCPIVIASDDDEVSYERGTRVISVVPFSNLDDVASEASQSPKTVLNWVVPLMVPVEVESDDDAWLAHVPSPEIIVISSDDSEQDGSSVDNQ